MFKLTIRANRYLRTCEHTLTVERLRFSNITNTFLKSINDLIAAYNV